MCEMWACSITESVGGSPCQPAMQVFGAQWLRESYVWFENVEPPKYILDAGAHWH